MRKRLFIGALVAALAVVLAGGLLASNMGFKLNYTLIQPGGAVPEVIAGAPTPGLSQDGTNELSLPDFPQTGLATANDLRLDIGAPGVVAGVSRFVRSNNTLVTYTGAFGSPANFSLVAGDSYRVRVLGASPVNYIVVGSHNPSLQHTLIGPGGGPLPEGGTSRDGTNTYNFPYHSVAATASALRTEIGVAFSPTVSKLIRDNNTLQTYTGVFGSPADFALVPGAGYRVRIINTPSLSFVPNHY